ncbi:hypothetical protein ACYSNM_07160 [Myroides sp. LJL116]
MNKIELPATFKKKIASDLKTTVQTVHTSLCYFNNSPLAMDIRKMAKELLLEEASKIEI